MSTNYYKVSEYPRYQVLDMAIPDPVIDVILPEISDVDYIKDHFEKLMGLELSDPEDETVSEPLEKTQTLIYRFSLPFKTSIVEYQKFNRDIEWIKNKNPKWEVLPDMPKLGEESEAWIMVYKDENYLNSRLSYLINTSISSSFI